MLVRMYETLFITQPEAEAETVEKIRVRLAKSLETVGGAELKLVDWGKRKLAYAINRRTHGYYAVFYYKTADASVVSDMDATFRINDNMVRWLTLVDHPMTDKVYGLEEDLAPIDSDDDREERD